MISGVRIVGQLVPTNTGYLLVLPFTRIGGAGSRVIHVDLTFKVRSLFYVTDSLTSKATV